MLVCTQQLSRFLFEFNSTQYIMKKFFHPVFIVIITVITCAFIFSLGAHAQNVVRKGNIFEQVVDSTKRKSQDTMTDMVYRDRKGNEYPIYISTRGKVFILRTSKDGKVYRNYLKQVEEILKDETKRK